MSSGVNHFSAPWCFLMCWFIVCHRPRRHNTLLFISLALSLPSPLLYLHYHGICVYLIPPHKLPTRPSRAGVRFAPWAPWRSAHMLLCAYEKISAILRHGDILRAILRPRCHWGGWRGLMMKIADVTSVAWQQMCVSSWQGLAASPVSVGGWTYSSVGMIESLFLSFFLRLITTDSRCLCF